MINTHFGRYIPTLKIGYNEKQCVTTNIFSSIIQYSSVLNLTESYQKSKEWLDNHFGFVLLYHNNILIHRFCNYSLFKNTFKDLNIIIELENHLG